MFFKRFVFAAFTASTLAACAPTLQTHQVSTEAMQAESLNQMMFALQEEQNTTRRVFGIALRVLSASAPLCDDAVVYDHSLLVRSKYSFEAGLKRNAAMQVFKVGEQPSVRVVFEGSPADQAGIREGDTLIKVGTLDVGTGEAALKAVNNYLGNARKTKTPTPLSLVIARGDNVISTTIPPAPMCAYNFAVSPEGTVNAYADGRNIVLHQGIIDLARNDDEIALVVGHELAHNVLDHISKKQANVLLGGLGGALLDAALGTGGQFSRLGQNIGSQAYSPSFESEADYMGLYAVALAGYNHQIAPQFWRRMGSRHQDSITLTTTHPATAERFVALESTVQEINSKKAAGIPLKPNTRK